MKMKKIMALVLGGVLLLSGCGSKKADKTEPEKVETTQTENAQTNSDKLQVYTSFYAMYDFAKLIGGDKADVYSLCPTSEEPHDFEPKTSDMAKLSEADIFIYNGMGMESWAEKTASSVKNNDLLIVEASDGVPDIAENYDPHVWLDPSNAIVEMENIKNAFCEKDAKNADYYNKNFELCKEKTDKLINEYRKATSSFLDRNVVTAHEAYGYLCDAFNLNQTSIEGLQGESDPSPAKMAEIIDFIEVNNIKYIFAEAMDTSKVVESVAKETGAQVLTLSPFEGDSEGNDYFTVMEENLETLKKALG